VRRQKHVFNHETSASKQFYQRLNSAFFKVGVVTICGIASAY